MGASTSYNDGWGPLTDPNQHLAKPNHIILIFCPGDPYKMRDLKQAQCSAALGLVMSVGCLIGGIIALIVGASSGSAGGIIAGVILLVVGALFVLCYKKTSDRSKTIDPSTGYAYYCYDVYDQNIKLALIDKQKNTMSYPPGCQLGHILDYKEIRYYGNGSNASSIALKKNSANKGQRFQRNMMTLALSKRQFSNTMNRRVNALKNQGLNHVQLLYCQKYNIQNLRIAPQGVQGQFMQPVQSVPMNNGMQMQVNVQPQVQQYNPNVQIPMNNMQVQQPMYNNQPMYNPQPMYNNQPIQNQQVQFNPNMQQQQQMQYNPQVQQQQMEQNPPMAFGAPPTSKEVDPMMQEGQSTNY